MKKLLLWGFALGTLAVIVADLMHQNDGYALIVFSSWRVEMSLNFLVLAVLSTLLVGAFLLKLLQGTLRLPGWIARYRALRRQRKGEQAFLSSLRLLLEGHFEASIKAAERSRKLGFATGYADLLAARAAQGLDDQDRAAVWLGRVDADDRALIAARLQQEAEMLVARRQFDAALQVLMLAQHEVTPPRSTASLRAELRALLGTERWEDVLLQVRSLRPRDGLSQNFLASCRRQAHLGNLRHYRSDQERFVMYLVQVPHSERDADLLDAADTMLSRMVADQWTAKARAFIETQKIR
ncbi:MAG: heme biosynthesis HemY N-terminal domain-containing protein [Fluviibacter sp.]